MSGQAWTVVAIIVGAVALFASERLRIDVVALLVLVLLWVCGILAPQEALSGFSNEATLMVAAMFALSAGIQQTGALKPLERLLSRIEHPWLLTLAMMVSIAALGAFVKNTALVATFLPLALNVCARTRTSPARVLMPMAFAAQMGGVCTLLGTSSNLLANSLTEQHGLAGFGVFEFSGLGVILALVGIAYLMLVGRWLLPQAFDTDLTPDHELGKYVTELRVLPGSNLLDRTVAEARLGEKHGIYVLELLRGDARIWSPRAQRIEEGDVLLARGDWSRLSEFRESAGLAIASEHELAEGKPGEPGRMLAEVLVAPGGRLVGRTLRELDFHWHYNATVLAIHRRGQVLRDKLREVELSVGDVLMLLVHEDDMRRLREDAGLVVLSERDDERSARRRAPVAIAILMTVVAVAGLGWLPIVVSALIGVVAMALTGCFNREEVYEIMDWKVIVLLGAILPLGIAIDKSGLSHHVVEVGMALVGRHGPLAALLMVYLLTALLTELMGHNPAVVLMVGIGISVAHALGVDPRPFIVATAFAAATSFATPVGYPTNTMVYNAGGYRFTDFMKVGIPLILVFCAISMLLIPRIWPFRP